jgi:SAM-dependent methyltransferase
MMVAEGSAMRSLPGSVKGSECLDVACGSGRYLRVLAEAGAARAVGLDAVPEMLAAARRRGERHELVCGPSSNDFLFGRTAEVSELSASRRLALGTDSRLTGEGDLLAELPAARGMSQLSAAQLFDLVTTGGARLLRVRVGGRGRIRPG